PGIRDLMATALPTFWIVIVGQQEVGRGERVEIGSSFLRVSTFFLLVSYCVDRSAVWRTGHPPVFELLSTAFERVFHWWVVVSTVVRNEVIRDGCMGYRKGGP